MALKETAMSDISFRILGGPNAKGGEWMRIENFMIQSVRRVLDRIGLRGEFVLCAAEPRPGNAHKQGLNIQRYDTSDATKPAILMVAQPFGNNTCWLWRLQLPRDTNPVIIFAQMSEAVEEGWHLAEQNQNQDEIERTPEVGPDQPETPAVVQATGQGENSPALQPPRGPKEILKDPVMMACILDAVVHTGDGRSFDRANVSTCIRATIGDAYSGTSIGPILARFVKKGYVTSSDENKYVLSSKGREFLKDHGSEVVLRKGAYTTQAALSDVKSNGTAVESIAASENVRSVSEIQKDVNQKMANEAFRLKFLQCIAGEIQERGSSVSLVTPTHSVFEAAEEQFGSEFSARHIGLALVWLQYRGYLHRHTDGERVIELKAPAVDMLRKHGITFITQAAVKKSLPVAASEASIPQSVAPNGTGLLGNLQALKERAEAHLQASRAIEAVSEEERVTVAEIARLKHCLEEQEKTLEALRTRAAEARRIVTDSAYATAYEEFEAIKKQIFGS